MTAPLASVTRVPNNLERAKVEHSWKVPSGTVAAVVFSPDGKSLVSGGGRGFEYPGELLLWDVASGKVRATWKFGADGPIASLGFSPDGKVLAAGSRVRTVKLWDWAAGRRTTTLSESTGELYAVVFTPEGSRVLAAGVDRSIRMWRVERGEGSLGKLTKDDKLYDRLSEAAANMNQASVNLSKLADDIRKDPKRYLSIKVF